MKTALAELALVFPFGGVDEEVTHQFELRGERLGALVASKRPLTCVRIHVLEQFAWAAERLLAATTLVGLGWWSLGAHRSCLASPGGLWRRLRCHSRTLVPLQLLGR